MRRAATPKRKDSARVLAPFSMALYGGSVSGRGKEAKPSDKIKSEKEVKDDVLGLGQGSDVLTSRFAEDVGPEGDLGGVHFLCEGDADVAKGFVSFFLRARWGASSTMDGRWA